jgi:hypothetical protein
MYATTGNTKRSGKAKRTYKLYRCRLYGFEKSSKHVSIHMNIADAFITEHVVTEIGLREFEPKVPKSSELISAQHDLSELNDNYRRVTEALLEGLGDEVVIKGKLRALQTEISEKSKILDALMAANSLSTSL